MSSANFASSKVRNVPDIAPTEPTSRGSARCTASWTKLSAATITSLSRSAQPSVAAFNLLRKMAENLSSYSNRVRQFVNVRTVTPCLRAARSSPRSAASTRTVAARSGLNLPPRFMRALKSLDARHQLTKHLGLRAGFLAQ